MELERCLNPSCRAILPTKSKYQYCPGAPCEREHKAQLSIFSIPGVGIELPHPLQPVSKVVVLPLARTEEAVTEIDGIAFDLESAKPIFNKSEAPLAGIQYASGWQAYKEMGVSVIGAYDFVTRESLVFAGDKEGFAAFQSLLNSRRLAISFNGDYFDLPLLEAHGVTLGDNTQSYDLLQCVYESAGARIHKCKLDNIAEANLGIKKSGSGALAPVLWQRGKVVELVNYCLRDVYLLRLLVEIVMKDGELVDPRGNRPKLQIRRPSCQPLSQVQDSQDW